MKIKIILLLTLFALALGCNKENDMSTIEKDQDETTSLKAQGEVTNFTGTSNPIDYPNPAGNYWIDEATESMVSGVTLWEEVGAMDNKFWGTAELFVGATEIGGDYFGKWEMKWYGTATPPILLAYAVGVGTEGNVKGMFAEWTYTMDLTLGFYYETEGYIADKQLTKTMKTIKASGPFALFPPGHPSNDCDEGICQVYVSGSGNTSHLGKFTVENFGCFDVFGGTGQVGEWLGYITAANGDMILTELIYSWEADGYDWYLYDILGGTGRFDGASGYIENYGNTDYYNPANPFEGGWWNLEGEGIIVY